MVPVCGTGQEPVLSGESLTLKQSPKIAIHSCALAGLLLAGVSSATDWETAIGRQAVSSHESLDAYRPFCRTLGVPQNRGDWGEGAWNASFCSVNRFSSSTTDFDEVDDVRDFTSEALFAASAARLNRALTEAELRGIVRKKDKIETFDSLRLNPSGFKYLPAVEFFYRYRELEETQITHFFAPNDFNDVALSEYGLGLSKRIPVSAASEITLRAGYRSIEREGIVEFLPEAHEAIDHREAGLRWDWVQDRKADGHYTREAGISFYYVYQDIEQRIANPSDRDRDIFAAKARYKTDLSGGSNAVEIFAGLAFDEDRFGRVSLNKNDYFAGATFFHPDDGGYWTLTVQPAAFTSKVSNDASQENSQYRINVVLGRYFYTAPDAWWAIVIPYCHDHAHDGPETFESSRFGAKIQYKQLTWRGGHLRWFGSIGYDYQEFPHLIRNVHGVSANLSLSF